MKVVTKTLTKDVSKKNVLPVRITVTDYSTGRVHDLNDYSFDDRPILDNSSLTKVVI